MAAPTESSRILKFLIVFILISVSQPIELTEDEWEELRPDIAALHRLRGFSHQMFHQKLQIPSTQHGPKNTSEDGERVKRAITRDDEDRIPASWKETLQTCQDFSGCVALIQPDFDNFMESVEEKRAQDWLLGASEISHSYSQKLLVMTDQDKATIERVHEDYTDDPQYSIIVSKECLYNDSCVPKIDSYTVVKIFGSISEGGKYVSGLSGESLGNLLLNTPLQAAPVFSLDGNTTTEFQYNFGRVFLASPFRTIMEINQGDQTTYKFMEKPDSISSYQVPKRPVDHSTQYDSQQVILLQKDDPVVKEAATGLYEKHPKVSSVYVLDENKTPKLIHGESAPLSEDSRLVLVGHGLRDNVGEMRISGLTSQDVSEIIQKAPRLSDKIKTVSLVACEVGSDTPFIENLLKELRVTAGIETTLHLRNTVLQVLHTGEKIVQEMLSDGLSWRHKDSSKKVVANLDQNGRVVITNKAGSKGEAIFTNERNFLMPPKKGAQKKKPTASKIVEEEIVWPVEPRRFVNPEVFRYVNQNRVGQMELAYNELESLTWGLFHSEPVPPRRVNFNNNDQYVIAEKEGNNIRWIKDQNKLTGIIQDCFEIQSGEDVLKVIRHFASNRENIPRRVMIKDWIYVVDPKSLYVFPVGKRLNGFPEKDVMTYVTSMVNKESYANMRTGIDKGQYLYFMRSLFQGEATSIQALVEARYATYFAASIIAESSRNLRTFPLVLMGLNMAENYNEKATKFFFEDHPMARGGSWIDENKRGFEGAGTPEDLSKLSTQNPLTEVIGYEYDMFREWKATIGAEEVHRQMAEIGVTYNIFEDNSERLVAYMNDYNQYKSATQNQQGGASGPLGGNTDGYITPLDLSSAANLEKSFQHESYFSRASAYINEEIQTKLTATYGESLAGMRVNTETARIEDGYFICEVLSSDVGTQPVEFRTKLSPESQNYNEKMLKSLDTAVEDMEVHNSKPFPQVNKYIERAADATAVLGLFLGFKGTISAFEHGDVKAGVVGSLQTAHGVTAMTTAVIAKQTMSAETRIATAISGALRSPGGRGFMTAIPIVGIGFGIYNFEEDIRRGGAQGYIDAAIDLTMVGLDIATIAAPELAPILVPINLALSVVRMIVDDIYLGIEHELQSLPADAGTWQKLKAVCIGLGKGLLRFGIRVASLVYDWRYEEIEEGRRLVADISDHTKYYKITKNTIDFTAGDSSANGGAIDFILGEGSQSEFCMEYFVSSNEQLGKQCWSIDTAGLKDIILGVGESHALKYDTLKTKLFMVIPISSVKVVSGYQNLSYSRYGSYTGNKQANHFYAVQKSEDKHTIEIMLSYYYKLYGEPGDDIFFLGPQKSYVRGSGGKDTYIIPEDGGKTIIDNFDPFKEIDNLHFSVNYTEISVSKSGENAVLRYKGSHTVTIEHWFSGEVYRHMSMVSADGVLFQISLTVVSSVQLVASGINKMFQSHGETVDTTHPLLQTVINIVGSPFDDVIVGNAQNNVIDGGGGVDRLTGGEGEDTYVVKGRRGSSVWIQNNSVDKKTDLVIIEANLQSFEVTVQGDNVQLKAHIDDKDIFVILQDWFKSPADRHLHVLTKDLFTFSISENKADCLQNKGFTNCLRIQNIDYSRSKSALVVDLQQDRALNSVTEVRGSNLNDVIKGNGEHNVIIPGNGDDFMEGRGGEDWYVIRPGKGVKTINNLSPDLAVDILLLQEQYMAITSTCEGQNVVLLVHNRRAIILQDWFVSKNHQHMQIKTSDGITASLKTTVGSCRETLLLPLIVDYRHKTTFQQIGQQKELLCNPYSTKYNSQRNTHGTSFYLDGFLSRQEPVCFHQQWPGYTFKQPWCCDRVYLGFSLYCLRNMKFVLMNDVDSVKEMYGSSGFDIMVGNDNQNLLDPHTGGALMYGGEGKDTYIIKHGYGNQIMIDNFAKDGNVDTVQVEMDFLDGSDVSVVAEKEDLIVTITDKQKELIISLLNYRRSYQHQHLHFLSSDGVHFELKSKNSTEEGFPFQTEAFKVTLQQSGVDCHIDLSSQKNLSKVHTVQGCSSQSSYVIGNDQANVLIGGWKDDVMDGGDGADTLIGGNGADILIGGLGDDNLYGEDGNDTLMGDSGQDVFIPGWGADVMDGGAGRDAVVYRGDHEKREGVYVNLLTGQGRFADAEGDVLKDVEMVIGTIYSDILVSGYENSLLKGSDGNDLLVATGDDYLVGGDGHDIYLLALKGNSVNIDNCAKDNALDILYLSTDSQPTINCTRLPSRVLLTFSVSHQTTTVGLEGWKGHDHECGHLLLVSEKVNVSVSELLKSC